MIDAGQVVELNASRKHFFRKDKHVIFTLIPEGDIRHAIIDQALLLADDVRSWERCGRFRVIRNHPT